MPHPHPPRCAGRGTTASRLAGNGWARPHLCDKDGTSWSPSLRVSAGRVRVGGMLESYRRIAIRQARMMSAAPAQVVQAGTSAKTR